MEQLSPIDFAIIAGYMLLIMGLGVVLARRGGDFTDFSWQDAPGPRQS